MKMVLSENIFHDNPTEIAAGKKLASPSEEETVVITGMSGTFPEADNVTEFSEKLFNKVDMITDDNRRWELEHPEIPHRTGKIKLVNKFDASFFGVHYNQANTMDPMCRLFLEKAYESVIDAGMNPNELRGSKTGVFVGACYSESEKTWFYEKLQAAGFAVTGCIRSMMANRVSYYFGLDGPSCTIDTACSSSMYAFEYGYRAIREGLCDAAIIGGCNLCLHPYVSLQFCRLGVLSMDGRCKPFDIAANGYCRSEAICAVFLQKKKDARRIYASVIHAKTNCDGYKEQGITYPSGEIQQQLFENFYAECEIDPSTLNYVEAHGTGTKVGDPEEIKALVNTFCKGRKTPLKIGSVKSNIGHTEPASGLCSITKVIIAMETGLIPPNINLVNIRQDIEAFRDGSIQVVTEPTPWEGGMAGINSFGFGGANCHILLNWNEKSKINGGLPADEIPRLINTSGRTIQAVEKILNHVEGQLLDAEFCKLLHEVHKSNIQGHNYRGYILLNKDKSLSKNQPRAVQDVPLKKPLYFYFPGVYANRKNLDKSLLQFPIFKEVLSKMSKVLAFDVFNVVSNWNKEEFNNLINNFIGTTAVQIAMVDLLKSLGIVPDKIVGTSIGEVASAYAAGCITAEEAILTSYYIGVALKEINLVPSTMFLVDLPYLEVQDMASHGIEVTPVGTKASMVKGEKSTMSTFVQKMKKNQIKVTEMNTCHVPIHSSSSKNAASKMLAYLREIIVNEKAVPPQWLTSVVSNKCNAELLCKSVLEPLHSDVLLQARAEATVLEVGPPGEHHLSAFIKHPVFNSSNNVANTSAVLVSLGRLYLDGVDMNLSMLYPDVVFPVSRSTPMISPILDWDHSENWYVTCYKQGKVKSGEDMVTISLNDEEMEYISGHVIDGRNLFPATGYLNLVWEAVGNTLGKHYSEIPVIFQNVKFHRATTLSKDGSIDFTVLLQKSSGKFEVIEGGAAIVTGKVLIPSEEDIVKEMCPIEGDKGVTSFSLNAKDFYKELRLRGYNYKGLFRSVVKANVSEAAGKITWHNNWVAFMDNMLQLQIILSDTRSLFVPTSIDRVMINPKMHSLYVEKFKDNGEIPVGVFKGIQMIKSGGIEIYGLNANAISRRKNLGEAVLEKYHFIPNKVFANEYDMDQVVRIMVHTAIENEPSVNIKITEIPSTQSLLSRIIAQVLGDLPLIQPEITVLTSPSNPLVEDVPPEFIVEDKKLVTDQSVMIMVASNILANENRPVLESCLYALKEGGFIIAREPIGSELQVEYLQLVQNYIVDDEQIMMLRKVKGMTVQLDDKAVIEVKRDDLNWLTTAQEAMKNDKFKKVYFVSQNDRLSGILGLVNCIKKEPGGTKARCVFTFDSNAPKFSLNDQFYTTQLNKDLVINVFKDGKWGTYRHLKIEMEEEVKAEYVFAAPLVKGDVSSVKWLQGNVESLEVKDRVIVETYYCALNFRDIMLATGKLSPEVITSNRMSQDSIIGFEFSGIANGKRVMGVTNSKGLATKVRSNKHLLWEVPDEWTLEEAVTVPCVYLTAVYGLMLSGKLQPGESILIHAGTGGVGQAAINIALSYGCTIFTTVGTVEKKNFLLQHFPQLNVKNIGNSRDTSFEQLIMRETNGRGVDMVLNSLAEEKLMASARCLAPGGRFIEIGKFDISNNNTLGMELYKRGATFAGIMVDNHMKEEGTGCQEDLAYNRLLEEIRRGAVKPLVRKVFQKNELEPAFRYMAAGKHIGKVIIKINENDEKHPSECSPLYNCKPRFTAKGKFCYIITGGLGGFGLELADWLVLRGAKNLVLVSRKGISNGYQELRINIWKSYGVRVLVSTADITKPEGVVSLLEQSKALGPVKGIFNLAMVLKDGIFSNQTIENFKDSIGPKADSTIHFDKYSRKMCPMLEQFVVFSSVSCGRGNGGQTNYGWSNSVMERVCEQRRAEGLPATAIQWGAVGDTGLVAEMQDEHIDVVIGGTLQQRITSCLEVINGFLTQPNAIVSSMVVAEKRAGGSSADNIVDTVANILGLRDLKNVSLHSTLAELGMDSMMAVEIKQTLEREFEVFLSPHDIRSMTFAKLCDLSTTQDEKNDVIQVEKTPEFNIDFLINMIGEEVNEDVIKTVKICGSSNSQVFIAPGIEGQTTVVEPLSQMLETNVHIFQFNSTLCETVNEIANHLLPQILDFLPSGSNFNLIGYSWGGLLTLDLAYRLEMKGYRGKICLIDSSPDFMRNTYKIWASGSEDYQQITILNRVVDILCPQEKSKVETLLKIASSWEARIKILSEWSNQFVNFTSSFKENMINGIYSRIKAISKMEDIPLKSLQSPIHLIRPTELILPAEDNYGLSKYTKGPVTFEFIEGNHTTLLQNKATADAINSFMGFTDINNTTKVQMLNSASTIKVIKENIKNI
ncbi:fatty acid synthase-like [Cimex lectularius]|uniref:Fatty acid synthase n=1 Tax=Cimex lectularius TaxID=79782 RepID=A0A8I6TB67_CIMLE|nr:fatty acid synthase-like [Cimex lectularius]